MNIRSKIILITMPLIITPLLLILIVATLSSRNGITLVAREFLAFKNQVFMNYVDSQWSLLKTNNLLEEEEYVEISKDSIEDFSRTLINSESELIFALDEYGNLQISSSETPLNEDDRETLLKNINIESDGWRDFRLSDRELIAQTSYFEPFGWHVFVSVEKSAFYNTISLILYRILLIFFISLLVSVILLFYFSKYLTSPLKDIVGVIKNIITTNDLKQKVILQNHDEIGELGHFFNLMTDQLETANQQIKSFALKAVISQHKEVKIRNIFQKYVPKNVIDQYFTNPESMLVGADRKLGILFSDIRSFTDFSENIPASEVVKSLNKYFEYMVDVITANGGIIDKYIGDAIMAFFGAPVHSENDALQSVKTGLEMVEKLKDFNHWQIKCGREKFEIGVGINYGTVTIGNIGTEKKMDYTVIGDMVNLASRLEGLTKLYHEPIIISESVREKVKEEIPCRLLDRVVVKGKSKSTSIYTVRKNLTDEMKKAWSIHEKGLENYYHRDFKNAKEQFSQVEKLLPGDHTSRLFRQRCDKYILNPPDENWSGDTVLNRK